MSLNTLTIEHIGKISVLGDRIDNYSNYQLYSIPVNQFSLSVSIGIYYTYIRV